MTLLGTEFRFTYTGLSPLAGTDGVKDDPLLSLGVRGAPSLPNEIIALSELYVEIQIDVANTIKGEIDAWTVRARPNFPPTPDPASFQAGQWVQSVDNENQGWTSRIQSNDGTTMVFETPPPRLFAIGDWIRISAIENLFPNVTEDQAQDGFVDYRMITAVKTNGGTETLFRFHTVTHANPGVTIEIVPSNFWRVDIIGDDGTRGRELRDLVTTTTNPFSVFGVVIAAGGPTQDFDDTTRPVQAANVPLAVNAQGSDPVGNQESLPIILKRTIPAGVQAGECAFSINGGLEDDTGSDKPFEGIWTPGCVFSFRVLEIVKTLTITEDRLVYTRGAARIIGTIVDTQGRPLVGVFAFVAIVSGPGSVSNPPANRTDENGQLIALYTAPTSGGEQTAVLKLVVPEAP